MQQRMEPRPGVAAIQRSILVDAGTKAAAVEHERREQPEPDGDRRADND
jgi:hypothetical protein